MGAAVEHFSVGERYFVATRLEQVFCRCFSAEFETILEGGLQEPLYRPPAASSSPGSIQYREDYFASALHEVAHWCIAGEQRRLLVDYGYWYAADGRNAGQQSAFESVEYQPQALEWCFAKACGYSFRISDDNLESRPAETPATSDFENRVLSQVHHWQRAGLPSRAQHFFASLCAEFGSGSGDNPTLASLSFSLEELG